jgi:hypothetical protein
MAYERIGLVRPARRARRRFYSDDQLRWLGCVQEFNHRRGISLHGLSTLLRFVPCWAIRTELEEEGERDCCPSAYPAGSCLERVRQAYAGEAAAVCLECGIYRNNRDSSRTALREKIPGALVGTAPASERS